MKTATATMIACLAVVPGIGLRADPVIEWNALMLDGIRADNTNPPLSTRNLAILHTAIFDTINSITPTHVPYRFQLQTSPETDIHAAISSCGFAIVARLHPSVRGLAEKLHQTTIESIPDTDALEAGLRLGGEIAGLMLDSRQADGSSTDVAYFPSDEPGAWRRTPPYFRPPIAVNWGIVRPFCIDDIEVHMPPPPPDLNTTTYAQALSEVMEIGGDGSTTRTAEQSLIAEFWSDYTATLMPPGHWHEIAATVIGEREMTVADISRLFALISLAQADASIVCWEAKYRYNLWRPVTAIWRAGEDDNSATTSDPDWNQYIEAPPFPAYPSGHSTLSTTSAVIMSRFFGTDAVPFTARSDSLPGVLRSFNSLKACADEVGLSRIYGGIHFSFDNVEGKRVGRSIAERVFQNQLLNVADLPRLTIWRNAHGTIKIVGHGVPGQQIEIEASSDLGTWTSMVIGEATPGGITIDGNVETPAAFYRIRQN